VTALTAGEIIAFADDSILLRGELLQQHLSPANYALLPQQPVTCDAYGMILPADDRNWQNQVNQFLRSEQSTQIRDQWLADNLPEEIATLDYCLDRQF
jgi:ABC-type amino acid transport substrate-binding protein